MAMMLQYTITQKGVGGVGLMSIEGKKNLKKGGENRETTAESTEEPALNSSRGKKGGSLLFFLTQS